MEELKPCPFCGGTEIFVSTSKHTDDIYVVCNDCMAHGAWFDSFTPDPKKEAIKAWNKRVK